MILVELPRGQAEYPDYERYTHPVHEQKVPRTWDRVKRIRRHTIRVQRELKRIGNRAN